jgi:hypothetical protein
MTELSSPSDRTCSCGAPAIVGFGTPPEWLCQADFEARLRKTRNNIKAVETALTPQGDR